ncbi:MAG: hypothetical protein JWQ38_706 [Flavipsychrobacter sp.]|nr:hypothetical protein [Flavipsychrobacter sp.]
MKLSAFLLIGICFCNTGICQSIINTGDSTLINEIWINHAEQEGGNPKETDTSVFVNFIPDKTDTTNVSEKADRGRKTRKRVSDTGLAQKGAADAKKYYKKYKPARIGAIASGIFTLYGLIPMAFIYATPPAYHNLNFPDSLLMKQPEYSTGYIKKAKQIKKHKTINGFGLGVGLFLFFGIAIFLFMVLVLY